MTPFSNSRHFVSVFCGSSAKVAGHFLDGARLVARVFCENGFGFVYGGGGVGMMGALADEVLACGGEIRGVIPRFMVEREWAHPQVRTMDIVVTMAERKTRMIELGDIVMALPGGIGTLDEFFEASTLSQLGCLKSPLLIFNQAGYFDPLLELRKHMEEQKFMPRGDECVWNVVNDAEELSRFIAQWRNEARRRVHHASH